MRGKSGSGTSLVTGRPASLSSSIAVARCAAVAPARVLRVIPRGKVSLHRGRADGLPSRELEPERDEPPDLVQHPSRVAAGRRDEDPPPVQLDAGILRVHAGDGGHAEPGLHFRAERAARDAIAPREEGGARDEEIRLLGGNEVEQSPRQPRRHARRRSCRPRPRWRRRGPPRRAPAGPRARRPRRRGTPAARCRPCPRRRSGRRTGSGNETTRSSLIDRFPLIAPRTSVATRPPARWRRRWPRRSTRRPPRPSLRSPAPWAAASPSPGRSPRSPAHPARGS